MLVFKQSGVIQVTVLNSIGNEIEILTSCLDKYLNGESFQENFTKAVLDPQFRIFSIGQVDDLDQVFSSLGNIIFFDFDRNEITLRYEKKLKKMAINHDNLYEVFAFMSHRSIHDRTINFAIANKYLVIDQCDQNKYVNNHWFQNTLVFRDFELQSKPKHINFCLSCGTFTCKCSAEQDHAYLEYIEANSSFLVA